jgi:hypothetical protein
MRAFAPWNEAHWQNPRFNKLLLQARAKLNDTFRAEQYREICQIASDDGGSIIPFFANFVYARTKKVAHGPSLAASWEIDGCRGSHRPHTRTDTLAPYKDRHFDILYLNFETRREAPLS